MGKLRDSFRVDGEIPESHSEGILGYARGRLSIKSFISALADAVVRGMNDGFTRASIAIIDNEENSRVSMGIARQKDNNFVVSWRMKVQGGEVSGDVPVNCKNKSWEKEVRQLFHAKCDAALPLDTEATMKLVFRK